MVSIEGQKAPKKMAEDTKIERLAYIVASELNMNLIPFAWSVTKAAPYACEVTGRAKRSTGLGAASAGQAVVDLSVSGAEISELTKMNGMIVSRNLYTGQNFRTSTDTRDLANRIALKIERAMKAQLSLTS